MQPAADDATRRDAWLEAMSVRYGPDSRSGMTETEALRSARRYQAEKHEAGYAGIDWPIDYGGAGRDPLDKVIFEEAERKVQLPTNYFEIGLGMAVPILIKFATDKQWIRERAIAALRGSEIWCQLFSEPAAGSDLAGLTTRARRVDDHWELTGQKLWTSWAHIADYGIILARTDPSLPKHAGLTFFWMDMRAPGVTVRRIPLANGESHINEVFLDGVIVPDGQRIGSVGGGFQVAIATLMIERYVAVDSAGFGPDLDALVKLLEGARIGGRPALEDGRARALLAEQFAIRTGLEAVAAQAMSAMGAGQAAGPEGALSKLVAIRNRQRLSETAIDLLGMAGLRWNETGTPRDDWAHSWLGAPLPRIAGGTDEILLNTIAERVLELPKDPSPDRNLPFNREHS